MIKLSNVSFSYCSEKLLQDINVEINKGEIIAVVGINGSGKSTLLRLLAGGISPRSGLITLDGKEYNSFSKRDFAKHISVLPQTRNVVSMNVYDFVSCGRFPYLGLSGKLTKKDSEAIKHAIQITNLIGYEDRNLLELSGGERQRAYIAMAVAQDTPYILLDEPTTYLDISYRFELMSLLGKLRDNGKGVVTVLHDISLVPDTCDKVMILEKGKGADIMLPEEAFENGHIDRAFGINTYSFEKDGRNYYIFRGKSK